ncbi:MAG: 30S ribosomal protein S5 [Parcubacteria group bacterium CG11_big_fil_rev_8_21_14_0_20_39_14]|nr:MAG: 30S ribosomal protein S5 [Parcubacteria group bacterium CG11_big_fil_rev_8_21_14_0_20_39_14]PIS35244.1 MAG: 30S ribosomal protein S5 [Parcubacteria group bacterium CG08_land_8_20_14_0_20_38_56]
MPKENLQKTKDEFDSKLVDLARVVRVVAGGRRFSFRAVMVVGNRAGKVGVGAAKGADVSLAVEKATRLAKKNLITVPITEKGTIFHLVEAKYGASKILLKPLSGSRGIVAGGAVRAVCDLAGIKSISSKVISRSGNKLNNARATIKALRALKIPNPKS